MTKTGSILFIISLLIWVIFCPILVHEWKELKALNEETSSMPEEVNAMTQGNDEVSEELSSITQESDEMPDEFYAFKGKWTVGEYKEKYEGYIFEISEESIVYFGASSELGYYYDNYAELLMVFRQPPNLEIAPLFLCASIQLKGLDEWIDIIIDGNGKAIFVAGHLFFELDRVNEGENETVYNRVLEDGETFLDGYHNLILGKDIKRAALIYLDEDDIPELLVLKNGEYRLYSCDGIQITAIDIPNARIRPKAYGPKHNFENHSKRFFCIGVNSK